MYITHMQNLFGETVARFLFNGVNAQACNNMTEAAPKEAHTLHISPSQYQTFNRFEVVLLWIMSSHLLAHPQVPRFFFSRLFGSHAWVLETGSPSVHLLTVRVAEPHWNEATCSFDLVPAISCWGPGIHVTGDWANMRESSPSWEFGATMLTGVEKGDTSYFFIFTCR